MKMTREILISHSRPWITETDVRNVSHVLDSGMIAEGQKVAEFEQAVAKYLGLAGGVATSSGTIALFLALKALEIGPRDEVMLPTYVCRAVFDAVSWAGATPVLCDVSDDWCINLQTIRPHLTKHTKCIIVVHTFGIAADIEPIITLGIPVIEDCAQAFGSTLNGRKLGTFGVFCVCSFHATKLLCTGEGGMVLTKEKQWLERLRFVKNAENTKYAHRYRFPMTDIQAALGLSQLKRYGAFLEHRRQIANLYFAELRDLPVRLPDPIRNRSIFFRFPLRTNLSFDAVRAAFNEQGIQVRRGVDTLLHRLVGLSSTRFPGSERCYEGTLSIPLYPALVDEEVEHIVNVCRRILK